MWLNSSTPWLKLLRAKKIFFAHLCFDPRMTRFMVRQSVMMSSSVPSKVSWMNFASAKFLGHLQSQHSGSGVNSFIHLAGACPRGTTPAGPRLVMLSNTRLRPSLITQPRYVHVQHILWSLLAPR